MAEKEHLYEIDLMRSFIILGVVCVHVISLFNLFSRPGSATQISFETALSTFHFTREAFMFLTGLVLFVTYYRRPFRATSFWSKRFKLIFIPYVAWTLIYILFTATYVHRHWTVFGMTVHVLMALLTGNQFYLYFLVISMQLYLIFPLFLLWLKRIPATWHAWLFVASFALQLALMWLNKDVLEHLSTAGWPHGLALLFRMRDRFFLTYQFWFIAGALLSVHYTRIRAYVLAHPRMVYVSFALMLAGLWIHFWISRMVLHQDETTAVLVLQPIMVPYSLLMTMLIWTFGLKWAHIRQQPRVRWFTQFIRVAGSASFGVFLVHPLVLHFVAVAIYKLHPDAAVRLMLLPLAIVVVYGVSIAVATWLGRIPFISYVVGQKTELSRWKVSLSKAR